MKNKNIHLIQILLTFIIILSILIISFYKFDSLSPYKLDRYDDYIHFIMYFLLGFISFITFNFRNYLKYFSIVIFCSSLAFFTEYFQKFLSNRTYDLNDLYFDYIGLLIGVVLMVLFKYVKKIINK